MIRPGKVYILLLNWNAWPHTVECLGSLLHLDYPDYQIIVCDNGSVDDSATWVERWAAGEAIPEGVRSHRLRHLSQADGHLPVPMVRYTREQAEAGGDELADSARLILIENGSNLGYAGASNVGLRFALARGDFSHVWLLNNDTVVTPAALRHLVARMESDSTIGQCGSQLRYYHAPELVQARGGGSYVPWLAAARHVGDGSRASQPVDLLEVERRLSYLVGASLLVSRAFLERVGLLSEEYFFYFEELDWMRRANGRFKLGYVHESIVYHKGATSVTAAPPRVQLSRLGEFYYTRSRVRFTRIHHPALLPAVWLTVGAALLYRLATGRWRDARTLWAALSDPATYAPGPAVASSAPREFAE